MQPRCLRIGLTGGIGSGKSTVATLLQSMQVMTVDADAIARAATAPHGAAIDAIRTAFGSDYVTADGALDRERMRQLAFGDPAAKARLEAIVHPIVRNTMAAQTQLALATLAPCIVYDIPLLVESGQWRQELDRVLVIDCSPQTQMQRVQQRNGLPAAAVSAILAAQAPRLQRLQAADAVICNDGITIPQLEDQVRQVWARFGL